MQRLFLVGFLAVGMASCSSSSSGDGDDALASQEAVGGGEVTLSEDGSNNPFAFKKEDVQRRGNAITGGKRSRYDTATASAYAAANRDSPAYLKRAYQSKQWGGGKDYSTGSYQTGKYGGSGKKSWFSGRESGEANRVARADGQDFSTGSYRTGSANEAGKNIRKRSSGYVDSRASDGWGESPVILSKKQYRKLTMGQAKSMLGR